LVPWSCRLPAQTEQAARKGSVAEGSRRRVEQFSSLSRLGVDLGHVARLGLPDGKVAGVTRVITDAIVQTESALRQNRTAERTPDVL